MNMFAGAPFHEIMYMFKSVHLAVHDMNPDAIILWLALTPAPTQSTDFNLKLRSVNFGLQRMCSDSSKGVFIDTSHIFHYNDALDRQAFIKDSVSEDVNGWAVLMMERLISNAVSASSIKAKRSSRLAVRARTPFYRPGFLTGRLDHFN